MYYDEELFADRFDDVSIEKLADAAGYHFNIYAIRALAHAKSYKDYIQANEDKELINSLTYEDYITLTNGTSYKMDAAKALAHNDLMYQMACDLDTRALPTIY